MSKQRQHLKDAFRRLPRQLTRLTSSGGYLPVVDGLRLVAIGLVLWQHLSERVLRYSPAGVRVAAEGDWLAWWAGRGTVGVFLFYAISGFILGLPFARHHLSGGAPRPLGTYLLRRLTRLEPPYILWMSVFFVVLVIKGDNTWYELAPHLGASLLYVHNLVFHAYSPINPVAWSLEVEVQFYLLAPFLAFLFFRIKKAWVRRVVLAGAIAALVALQSALGWHAMPFKASLLGQLQHFLLGFLLVDLYLSGLLAPARWGYLGWDLLALLSLGGLSATWSEDLWRSLLFSLLLGSFLVGVFRGRFWRALLGRPWIAAIGGMCYTIYLIHLPLLELLTPLTAGWVWSSVYALQLAWQFLVLIPVIIACSIAAYLWLEKPFMDPNWPRQLGARLAPMRLPAAAKEKI